MSYPTSGRAAVDRDRREARPIATNTGHQVDHRRHLKRDPAVAEWGSVIEAAALESVGRDRPTPDRRSALRLVCSGASRPHGIGRPETTACHCRVIASQPASSASASVTGSMITPAAARRLRQRLTSTPASISLPIASARLADPKDEDSSASATVSAPGSSCASANTADASRTVIRGLGPTRGSEGNVPISARRLIAQPPPERSDLLCHRQSETTTARTLRSIHSAPPSPRRT